MMRRTTAETDISLALGTEVTTVRLEDPVLAHMLRTLFFYMKKKVFVEARYDLRHHLWEDVGITIGCEIKRSYDRTRIQRYGSAFIPMDDALVMVALDFSREYVGCDLACDPTEEGFEPGLFREFLWGLARNAGLTVHVKQLSGTNPHHILEAGFKALGTAMRIALEPSEEMVTTKGVV